MTGRTIAFAVIAAGVVAGGVALAIAVNADVPDPEAKAHDKVDTHTERPATPPPAPTGSGSARRGFVPLAGQQAPVLTGEKYPVPTGGFAAWTGREGLVQSEIDEFVKVSGMRQPLALEQRRSTLLEERTGDPNFLGQLLGQPPTGFMLATIGTQAKVMHDAAAQAQVANREGKLSDDDAIRATRAAQDTYRSIYQRVTGLSDTQFDRFFAPERPLP